MPLLLATACSSQSEVVPLTSDTFGLTIHSSTAATSARVGVERAKRYCEERGQVFEVIRTEIGQLEYQIAFKCNQAEARIVPEPDGTAPAFVAPEPPEMAPPETRSGARTRQRARGTDTRRSGTARARSGSSDTDASTGGTSPRVERY